MTMFPGKSCPTLRIRTSKTSEPLSEIQDVIVREVTPTSTLWFLNVDILAMGKMALLVKGIYYIL